MFSRLRRTIRILFDGFAQGYGASPPPRPTITVNRRGTVRPPLAESRYIWLMDPGGTVRRVRIGPDRVRSGRERMVC